MSFAAVWKIVRLQHEGYPCPQCRACAWQEILLGVRLAAQCKRCGFTLMEDPLDSPLQLRHLNAIEEANRVSPDRKGPFTCWARPNTEDSLEALDEVAFTLARDCVWPTTFHCGPADRAWSRLDLGNGLLAWVIDWENRRDEYERTVRDVAARLPADQRGTEREPYLAGLRWLHDTLKAKRLLRSKDGMAYYEGDGFQALAAALGDAAHTEFDELLKLPRFLKEVKVQQDRQQEDETAYRPATEFIDPERCPTYKSLHRVLNANPWIRTRKPSLQRLEIHAGDWQKYLAQSSSAVSDPLDLPADVVDALAGIEQRKTQERRHKAGS